jgi:PAS domain S-box-containing protein
MTRQIAKIAKQTSNVQYHITSLKPIRPANKPEGWETTALFEFENGDKDEFFQFDQHAQIYQFMAPLLTKEACLKCHAKQGYKLGDIRGGISVTIPAKAYIDAIKKSKNGLLAIHLVALVLGVGLFCSLTRYRNIQEQKIQKKNKELEHEILERKQIEESLKESEEKFHFLSKVAFEGIIISEKGKILETNETFCELTGYQPSELFNTAVTDLVAPEERENVKSKILENYQLPYVTKGLKKDGLAYPAEVHGKMFSYKNRQVRVTSVRDLTEQKKTQEERKKLLSQLQEAQKIAQLGHWELNLKSNTLYWSDEIYRIFDLNPQKFKPSYKAFIDLVHPDDRDSVNKAFTESVKNKEPYDIKHRIVLHNGDMKWVHERGTTEYNGDDKPKRSIGTVHNITEIQTLRGIVPICSFCKKIRNDEGYYEAVESYVSRHSDADFSHTFCPECGEKHYPEVYGKKE